MGAVWVLPHSSRAKQGQAGAIPPYCKAICARTIPTNPTKIKNKFLHTTSLQTGVCKDVVFVG